MGSENATIFRTPTASDPSGRDRTSSGRHTGETRFGRAGIRSGQRLRHYNRCARTIGGWPIRRWGTGTAADVSWPKSAFEQRARVISSLPATAPQGYCSMAADPELVAETRASA